MVRVLAAARSTSSATNQGHLDPVTLAGMNEGTAVCERAAAATSPVDFMKSRREGVVGGSVV